MKNNSTNISPNALGKVSWTFVKKLTSKLNFIDKWYVVAELQYLDNPQFQFELAIKLFIYMR